MGLYLVFLRDRDDEAGKLFTAFYSLIPAGGDGYGLGHPALSEAEIGSCMIDHIGKLITN